MVLAPRFLVWCAYGSTFLAAGIGEWQKRVYYAGSGSGICHAGNSQRKQTKRTKNGTLAGCFVLEMVKQ
jgi:hypothetical protein